MNSMDISLELGHGKDFGAEVVITVDFKIISSGCPAHMGSFTYAGHPAEPMEIEIETVFWPIKRWDAEKREFVADHMEFPWGGLPDDVADGVEAYIVEHFDLDDYYNCDPEDHL